MRLVTVGTGTAAPSPHRVQSGHLVEAGEVRVLIDCGSGVSFRMAQRGIRWQDVTHLAITHFHADHTTDLATLVYAWRYGQLPPREQPLEIIGPPGTLALVARHADAFGRGLLAPGFPLTVRELPPGGSLPLGDSTTISSRKVPHTEESVAYSIERGGRRVVYTGDTGPDPELGAWARGCDVLLAECSLPSAMAMAIHLTPEQCGELAADAAPALLALTHFYPPVEQVDIVALVGERFGGPLALAVDGWSHVLEDA